MAVGLAVGLVVEEDRDVLGLRAPPVDLLKKAKRALERTLEEAK